MTLAAPPAPQNDYGATTVITAPQPSLWRRPTTWLISAAIGMLCVSAGLGPGLTYKEMRRIKSEIAALPLEERERLDRNLAAFQKMSPAEHRQLITLHENVEARGLTPLLDEYNAWLETLSPFQRQALREREDPAARIGLVERLLSENQELNEQRLAELISQSTNPQLRVLLHHQESVDFESVFLLTEDQIKMLIDDILVPQLNPSQQQQLQSFSDDERIPRVLRASLSMLNNPRESWPTNRTFDMLAERGINLQEEQDETERRREIYGRPVSYEDWRRFAFRRLLIRSLLIAEMREFEQQHPVRENDLLNFFAKQDSSAQAKILDSPAEYQTEALKWLYLWETYRDDGLFSREDFRVNVLTNLAPFPWGDRGPGRFDGRGGDRRGPDGRGPEGRGPEGRGGPNDRDRDRDRPGRPFPMRQPPPRPDDAPAENR